MTIAIMQPYIFPYIGYFQLISAVDRFIIYDDVNYIKQGWVNRNNILIQGEKNMFTIPLAKASQNIKINETLVNQELYKSWKAKFIKSLEHSYKKATYFNEVFALLTDFFVTNYATVASLTVESLKTVSEYLNIETEIVETSSGYNNDHLSAQERILDICLQEKATHYINPIGGLELYSKEDFKKNQIKLNFIKSNPIEYKQFKNEFVPWLSIIDVMMFNSPSEISEMLNQYELV